VRAVGICGSVSGEKKVLIFGAHMSVTRERSAGADGRRNPEGKHTLTRAPTAHRPGGPAGRSGGLRGGLGQLGVSWAGWVRHKIEFKWKFDFEFQMNLDFGRNLRNCTRRFRRNLDMGIFPKFF
jgi:hypothetical protein